MPGARSLLCDRDRRSSATDNLQNRGPSVVTDRPLPHGQSSPPFDKSHCEFRIETRHDATRDGLQTSCHHAPWRRLPPPLIKVSRERPHPVMAPKRSPLLRNPTEMRPGNLRGSFRFREVRRTHAFDRPLDSATWVAFSPLKFHLPTVYVFSIAFKRKKLLF